MLELEAIRAEMESRSTEELVAILQKRDEDVWRPEVFEVVSTILRDRGVSIDRIPVADAEDFDFVERQPLATVARFFSPTQAHAFRMALEQIAIPAWITDEGISAMYGVGIGNRVWVRAADLAAAQALLESEDVTAESLPPDIAEPPCSRCGSRKTSQRTAPTDEGATEGHMGFRRKWLYVCGACGHEWGEEEKTE